MNKSILWAAVILSATQVAGQEGKTTIEGNGKLVTRSIAVNAFNNIKASGVYELQLTQGDVESVKVEADENLQELFQIKNDGSTLTIEMNKKNINLKSKNKMIVYVSFKKLHEMKLHTVGNVTGKQQLKFDDLSLENHSVGNVNLKLKANHLKIQNNSVGNVILSGDARSAEIKNSGVGALRAGDLVVETMDIENSGIGQAEVHATKELKVKDSFLGKVKNKGKAELKKMNKVLS